MPLDRKSIAFFEYGHKDPDKIPPGRITLKKAMQFINDYQTNPNVNTISKLSDEYLLSEDAIRKYDCLRKQIKKLFRV